jgi:hypothetical protein
MTVTDPALDPELDLVDTPQDDVPHQHVRLGTVLALLRILGGERGHAAARWSRFGFSYTLTASREDGDPGVDLDDDDAAPGGEIARARLLDALEP